MTPKPEAAGEVPMSEFRRGQIDYREGALYDVRESPDWIEGWLHEFNTSDVEFIATPKEGSTK